MTLLTDTRKQKIVCDGSATSYEFEIRFNNPLEIKILVITRATGEYYQLKPFVHATVTYNSDRTGGVILYTEETKPTNAIDLLVIRTIPLLQKFRLPTESLINIKHFEHQLDRVAMLATQMQEKLNRAMISSPTTTEPAYTLAPQAATRALIWNSGVDGFDNSARGADSDISLAAAALVASIAAEVAAEAAQALAELAQSDAEAIKSALSGLTGLTTDERAALDGTSGTPGNLNRYFTETDPAYISPDTIQGELISSDAPISGNVFNFSTEWTSINDEENKGDSVGTVGAAGPTLIQNGGTIAYTWQNRVISNIINNSNIGITLPDSYTIRIPPGSYYVRYFSQFLYSGLVRLHLIKASDSSVLINGMTEKQHASAGDFQMVHGVGIVTLTSETDVKMAFNCSLAKAGFGQGLENYDTSTYSIMTNIKYLFDYFYIEPI